MKKKSLKSQKLLLKKATIAAMNKGAVKGGIQTATVQTFCGPACGETEFFTACNGARNCSIFDTQFVCR